MCIFCERAARQLAEGQDLTTAQKREAEHCEQLRERRVRVTILTGFLGAGKTTFLNFVLKSLAHGQRVAVVQNEFGSVSVDDQLMSVERSDTEVIVMPNGCLCCKVRGDLVEALRRLAAKSLAEGGATSSGATVSTDSPAAPPLDALLIECSGLSEVLPVAQTFFADPYVQASYQLDGVVCVCDAANFEALEGGGGDMGGTAGPDVARLLREQLALSDACLLNKCDLVDAARRDRIGARIRAISPAIKVVPCRHGKVNLGQVLKIGSFSLETALLLDTHFLQGGAVGTSSGHGEVHGSGHGHGGQDDTGANHAHSGFGSLGFELDGPVDLEALKDWLRGVVERHGERLIRIKGVVCVGAPDGRRAIVQGVGGHIEVGEEAAAPARGIPGSGMSRLVLIGRLGDFALAAELRAGFLATAARGDAGAGSQEATDAAMSEAPARM